MAETNEPHDPKRVDLVFEGGGVKGVALVGALGVLEEHGYVAYRRAGTSAGAIVAALHAAGYGADELHAILRDLDFRRFTDRGLEDRIPLVGAPLSVLLDLGVFEGDALLAWMRGLLEARDVRTFGDLPDADPDADDILERVTCQIVASDLTSHRIVVFPRDARRFGIDPADFEVALAVRMSTAIPFFFEPVRQRAPDGTHTIVDGGVLSNFPVWLFDTDNEPSWPTFGLRLVDPTPTSDLGERIAPDVLGLRIPIARFVSDLIQTMIEAHDRLYVSQADFARMIPIPTLGIRTTEFDLTRDQAEALYQSGRDAAEAFLERWDFDDYVSTYRRGVPASRCEAIEGQMRADRSG